MSTKDIHIKFWGVRGSIPTPISPPVLQDKIVDLLVNSQGHDVSSPDAARAYLESRSVFDKNTIGGNTACIEVNANGQHIIIDCGSGIKELGWALMDGPYGRGEGEAHILLSHTHWDHIMGFPFFQPAYVPGNKLNIYSAHKNLRQRFKLQHHPYNFPVPMDAMAADIQFKKLSPNRKKHLKKITIEPFKLEHPGDSYAYRIESGKHTLIYASDGSYNDPSPDTMAKYYTFYQNADALIFDAHFDLIESFEKSDWGHSTSFIGVDIALHANVKRLVLFHHDPLSDDRRLQKFLKSTRRYLNHVAPNADLEVVVAHEGLELTV